MKLSSPIFILTLFLIQSCKKDPVELIDSSIKIKLWETLDSNSKSLQFYCETEKVYGCMNYGIQHTLNISSNKIDIYFKKINVENWCENANGPATTIIDLKTLTNGTYNLQIKKEGETSFGKLIVNSNSYSVNLNKQESFKLINPQLNRIPPNSIWGIINYHKSSTIKLVQTFIDSVKILGGISQILQPGDYGYFDVDSKGQVLPPNNYGHKFGMQYFFSYSNNSSQLKKLVSNYGMNYNDSLQIILTTTKGEVFRSWLK